MTTAAKPDFTRCPHIISFINSKGGTGKTMFVLHTVTHILARQPDAHILILDGVRGSFIPAWLKIRQFYLSGNRPTSHEAHRVTHRGIPYYGDPDVYYDSSLAMGSINVQPIADDIDWPDLLFLIFCMQRPFDYVLIDTQCSGSVLAKKALALSDLVVSPALPGIDLQTLSKLEFLLLSQRLQHLHSQLPPVCVVISNYMDYRPNDALTDPNCTTGFTLPDAIATAIATARVDYPSAQYLETTMPKLPAMAESLEQGLGINELIASQYGNDIATPRALFGRVFESFMAIGDASPLRASRQQALLELGDKLWHYRSVEYAVPFQVPDRSMAPRSVLELSDRPRIIRAPR